jgi:hypothetical protein
MKKLFGSAMTCALLATLAFAGNAHAYYPTGVDSGDGGAGYSDGGCGSGKRESCGTKTTTRCLEWKTVSSNSNITIGSTGTGGGIGVTVVCSVTETTTVNLYRDV